MPQEPSYRDKIYDNLVQAYGQDTLPSIKDFNSKLDSDKEYAAKLFDNLSEAYGENELPARNDFYERIKKKDYTKPLSIGYGTAVEVLGNGGPQIPLSTSKSTSRSETSNIRAEKIMKLAQERQSTKSPKDFIPPDGGSVTQSETSPLETGITGVVGGTLKAASALSNIPNAVFDYAIAPILEAGSPTDIAQPRALTNQHIENVRKALIGDVTLLKGMTDASGAINKTADKILKGNRELEGKTMVGEMANGNVLNAAKIFTAQAGELVPIIAASIYAPGAVVPTIFAQNIQSLEGRDDLTYSQKSALAGALSTIQGVAIPAAASGITAAFPQLVEKEGLEAATKKLADTYTQVILRNSGKAITPTIKNAAIGASMDLASQVATQHIDPNAPKEIDWKSVADNAILFGVPAGVSHLTSQVHHGIVDKKSREQAKDNTKKIETLAADIEKPEISLETKDVIAGKHNDLVAETNDLVADEAHKHADLTPENATKIEENISKINALEHSIENEPLQNKDEVQKTIDELHKENEFILKTRHDKLNKEKNASKIRENQTSGTEIGKTKEGSGENSGGNVQQVPETGPETSNEGIKVEEISTKGNNPTDESKKGGEKTETIPNEKNGEKEVAKEGETKKEVTPLEKENLEKIAEKVGKSFREVQNVYTKYDGKKPLSEITESDYSNAEKKRQEAKENLPDNEPAGISSEPSRVTSIKNEVVDQERIKRGLAPANEVARKEFGVTWDNAMHKIEKNPSTGNELVAELKNKSRPLTDEENAVLLHKQIDIQNQYDKTNNAIIEAEKSGDKGALQEESIRLARLSDELLDIYNIGKAAGTENARGLNARKLLAKEDFTLSNMVTQIRAANGGKPLDAKTEAHIAELNKKIEDTQRDFDEYVANVESKKSIKKAQEDFGSVTVGVLKERKSRKPLTKENLEAKKKALLDEAKDILKYRAETPEIIPLGKAGAERNPELVPKKLIPILKELQKLYVEEAINNKEKITPDELVADIYDELGGKKNQFSHEDIRDAISGYGKSSKLSQEELDVEIRKMNRELRDLSALDFIESGERPLKSGFQRDKLSLEERARQKDIRKKIREKGVELEKTQRTPEEQYASALDSVKTRLKNRIEDLTKQIAEGRRSPKKVGVEYDTEAKQLKEESDRLSEALRQIEGKNGLSDLQKLQTYKSRLEGSIKEYERKIKEKDYSKKKVLTYPLDAEALKLKAESERVKDEFRSDIEKARLKNRTNSDKFQDFFVKWERAFKLSGVTTLAKLTAAALERTAITPIEEAVGSVYSKLLPKLASNARREGNANLRIEAKALTEGFTKGLEDSYKTLTMRGSDLEQVYGKKGALPPEAADFLGHLHGALKAPVKRNEFTRSFEKRSLSLMKSGVDVSDPLVQTKIATEAYKDAQKAIFMQDNRVATAWSLFTNYLDSPNKEGKHTTKYLATIAKTLLPFVKIPTNIVAETGTYATGAVTGSIKLATAMYKGIENVTPEEADIILRHLKKGSLGTGLLLLGFFNPDNIGGYYQPNDKDKKQGYGTVKLYGMEIPKFLVHNPLLETLQIGATIRKVADKHGKGIDDGILAATLGLAEEIPFVGTPKRIFQSFESDRKLHYFLGDLAKSTTDPVLLQEIAKWHDQYKNGKIKRDPKNILEHIETGIPFLRENVSKKKK